MYDESKAYYKPLADTFIKFLAIDDTHPSYLYSKMLSVGNMVAYMPENKIDQNVISYAMDNLVRRRGIVLQKLDECTAVEAALAIAAHYVDFTINGGDYNDDLDLLVVRIFWAMLDNMGLLEFSDANWIDGVSGGLASSAWIGWGGKVLEEDGKGSPFYLGCSKENLPKNFVTNPYWVQMDWWFDLNKDKITEGL